MVVIFRFELLRVFIKGIIIMLWVLFKGKKIFKCVEVVGRLMNIFYFMILLNIIYILLIKL